MASQEMSFENVDDDDDDDDGRTTDACLYCKLTYEPSAQVELKIKRRRQTLMYTFFSMPSKQ